MSCDTFSINFRELIVFWEKILQHMNQNNYTMHISILQEVLVTCFVDPNSVLPPILLQCYSHMAAMGMSYPVSMIFFVINKIS